jgi:hypothetical protein
MKTSNINILSVPMFVAGSIALSGCGRSTTNPTTISYHQVGICKSYDTPTGVETSKADEGFAVFKIETIDNTKNNTSFDFEPERLDVNQSTPEQKATHTNVLYGRALRFVIPDPRFAKNMGFTSVARVTVPAGEKQDINGIVVVPLALNNPTGGPEANQYSFEFEYDTTTHERQSVSEGIAFVKTNSPDTKYSVVENCKEVNFK